LQVVRGDSDDNREETCSDVRRSREELSSSVGISEIGDDLVMGQDGLGESGLLLSQLTVGMKREKA
jgi:hypothetical protein